MEMASLVDLSVTKYTPPIRKYATYQKIDLNLRQCTISNVTMTMYRKWTRINRWQMIKDRTASYHQYIIFEVTDETATTQTPFP